MKKILLATSILAATTGFAAAEVALTGDARMGVVYDGNDVQFSERARVRFNLSGQTDTGLEFGATFRADHAGGSAGGSWNGRSSDKLGNVWISGAFGKLAMGDVNSAAEQAFGDLSAVGFTGLSDLTDIPYLVGDEGPERDQGPGALYTYSTGAFEFHLGMTDGNAPSVIDDASGDLVDGVDRDTTYSVAAAYNADTFKVGLGYIDAGDVDTNASGAPGTNVYGGSQWIVYGSTELSGFGLKAYYTSFDDLDIDKVYGLSVDYAFGATTVTGFARRDEYTSASNISDEDSFGIGAAYDLGGGASLVGGVVDTDTIGNGETIADFGVKLKF